MIFKALHIYKSYDGINSGRINFEGEKGEIQLKLDDAACAQLLVICAEAMVKLARETANNLTTEIIDTSATLSALLTDKEQVEPIDRDRAAPLTDKE